MNSPPKLLDEVRTVARLKHLSLRTEKAYTQHIKRFILFHNKRHPNEMAEADIRAYLSDLAINKKVAASTQNVALAALLFLYKDVLKQSLERIGEVERARLPSRMPVVFTKQEAAAVLSKLSGSSYLVAALMYGSGLRLLECLRLRVKDLDFAYNQIHVRCGKGAKDRVTVFPTSLKEPVRKHLLKVKLLHQYDLQEGFGGVMLPNAMQRKLPHTGREWAWQYVFPASKRSTDQRSKIERRHHLHEKHDSARGKGGDWQNRNSKERHFPLTQAQLCDTSSGRWLRHQDCPGIIGAQRRADNDDLYTRLEPRRSRREKSVG